MVVPLEHRAGQAPDAGAGEREADPDRAPPQHAGDRPERQRPEAHIAPEQRYGHGRQRDRRDGEREHGHEALHLRLAIERRDRPRRGPEEKGEPAPERGEEPEDRVRVLADIVRGRDQHLGERVPDEELGQHDEGARHGEQPERLDAEHARKEDEDREVDGLLDPVAGGHPGQPAAETVQAARHLPPLPRTAETADPAASHLHAAAVERLPQG